MNISKVEYKIDTEMVESFLENKKSADEWKQVLQHYKSYKDDEDKEESTNAFMLRTKFNRTVNEFIEDMDIDAISVHHERTEQLIKLLERMALSFDFRPLYNLRNSYFL